MKKAFLRALLIVALAPAMAGTPTIAPKLDHAQALDTAVQALLGECRKHINSALSQCGQMKAQVKKALDPSTPALDVQRQQSLEKTLAAVNSISQEVDACVETSLHMVPAKLKQFNDQKSEELKQVSSNAVLNESNLMGARGDAVLADALVGVTDDAKTKLKALGTEFKRCSVSAETAVKSMQEVMDAVKECRVSPSEVARAARLGSKFGTQLDLYNRFITQNIYGPAFAKSIADLQRETQANGKSCSEQSGVSEQIITGQISVENWTKLVQEAKSGDTPATAKSPANPAGMKNPDTVKAATPKPAPTAATKAKASAPVVQSNAKPLEKKATHESLQKKVLSDDLLAKIPNRAEMGIGFMMLSPPPVEKKKDK